MKRAKILFNALRRGGAIAPLLGLALFLVSSQTSSAGARVVISKHGAVGDGQRLNTVAIQAAIDQCAANGGGDIVVPKGTFVTGAIFLKQGVNLVVEKGAILKGSSNTNDYPWINTRIAGLEMRWPAALVNAEGVAGLKITGAGMIDGSGERWWREYWEARNSAPNRADPHFKIPRPRLVHLMNATNVLVQGVTLKNSAFWNLQLTYCEGAEVRDVTIRAPIAPVRAASSDGIDVDSSRNVLITGCDIECADDAICLKSGRDADGLRVNRPTENVVIKDCRVGNAAGLVVVGSETSGGIRNVKVMNCRADEGCEEIVRFKTKIGRGGVVENILYENITAVGTARVFSFNMNAFSTMWVPEGFDKPVSPEQGMPVFRNIVVRNLTAKDAESAGRIAGLAETPLQNLRLENVNIEARKGFVIENTVGLQFESVKLNGKPIQASSFQTASKTTLP
ncbi:MAG: glycoside hydrolase family 28 protein [Verrucomicrobiota bacterium]